MNFVRKSSENMFANTIIIIINTDNDNFLDPFKLIIKLYDNSSIILIF